VPEVLDDQPSRALAVYAHPNDSDVACAGTLARWIKGGSEVALVICAAGDKGSPQPQDPVELAGARADEVAAAADLLGVGDYEILGYPDGEVSNSVALRERLVGWVRRWRPDTVLGPDPTAVFFGGAYVNHRDHREVGWALLDTVAPAAGSPLYFPEAGPPHQVATLLLSGSLEPDAVVDIGEQLDTKAAALRCHTTQLGGDEAFIDEFVRRRSAEAGAGVGVSFAEAFRRVSFA
jgi:LmbE family N-acetylglucosaminyl deacetylase